MDERVSNLYKTLQKAGADVGTEQEFDAYFHAKGDQGYKNRYNVWKTFKDAGADIGENYEEFRDWLGLQPRQQNQPAKPAGAVAPTWQEQMQQDMAGVQQTIGETRRAVNRLGNRQQRAGLDVPSDFGRVNLGENRKVTKGQQRLNPETGKLENTYITEAGNEYEKRELADMEQNAVDQAAWDEAHPEESLTGRIDSQLADLQQKRDEAYASAVEKARQANAPESGVGKFIHNIFTPDTDKGIAVRDVNMDIARQDKDVQAFDVAIRDLQDAKTMLQRNRELKKSGDFLGGIGLPGTKDWFNNWKNFGYGVWDALGDVTINAAGSNDIEKASTYLRIKDKIDRGEELTDSETGVALAGMSLAQAQQLADLPTAYTAGQTTAEMAPFMVQMAANPASGIGKALARKAVRQFGRNGIGAVAARVGARVLGNVAEAAVISNTLQAGKTAADIAERHAGKQFAYDEDGNIVMGHYENVDGEDVFVEGGDDLGTAIYKGEAASIIENFTELGAGGSINGMLSKAAGSKLGQKIGLGYISDLVGKVGSTPFAKATKQFMARTHWDGMIEEPLEEEYGIILNSLLTGDNKISDLWDSKQQADIFAGTMWFGGFMAGLNTAAYPVYRHQVKKQLNLADAYGAVAFGEEWDAMKGAIDMMEDKNVTDYLYSIKDDDAFSKEQKAALFGYAARLKQYQGANVADMLNRMEDGLSEDEAAIRGAYDLGVDAETPDDMKKYADEAEAAEAVLPEYGQEFAKMVLEESDNPVGVLGYMMDNRDYYTDDQMAAAADYFQKKARADGMMDAVLDKVDVTVEQANAEIRGNMHQQSGNVIMAEHDGQSYYVIGGDFVNGDDAVSIGTGGAVVVKDAETGEISVKPAGEMTLLSMQSADELMQQNETALRGQLMQQAEDDIAYGSPAQEVFGVEDEVVLRDYNGNEIVGTIGMLPNSIDGVYVVYTPDNKALQYTGDELNRMVVSHNGMEVARTSQPAKPAGALEGNGTGIAGNGTNISQNGAEIAENRTEIAGNGTKTGGILDNAGGEAGAEGTGANEPSATALSRIPVAKDEKGQPKTDKKGRPVYEWHKASLEDATDALIEKSDGDLVMARDTASYLVKNSQDKLEKIRKQKPKGEDPMDIIESRREIRRAEQEQQAIVKRWQDVGTTIRKRMDAEAAAKRAEEEAKKSEEQKAREAEAARLQKEQQERIQQERRRKQVEEELANWNKPYGPLSKARREMEGDTEASAILNDTEPRTLEEWVSSLIRPQSMMWDDETDPATGRTIVGLQSEIGLQKKDIERIGGLVASRQKGGKPFGQVVHDIWEDLPEGMKEMYDDQDVRNTLIGLFGEGNTMRMRHLTEEHRIEEAREMMKENQRRDAEAEMDAWAEAYHLNPEERETFEDWIAETLKDEARQTDKNIGDYEQQNQGSSEVDSQHPERAAGSEGEGGEGQVQGQGAQVEGVRDSQQQGEQGTEANGNSPSVSGGNVPGGIFRQRFVDSERQKELKQSLIRAYATGNSNVIQEAVSDIREYIEEGGDFEGGYSEAVEDYQGNNPETLTDKYITHAMLDVYLDEDEDQDYIATGLSADMRKRDEEAVEENLLADRFEMSGNVEESETNNGTEYREPLTVDGQYIVEKVDSPDEKGYYNGSRYEFDGESFGSLREVMDYIDQRKAAEPQPAKPADAMPAADAAGAVAEVQKEFEELTAKHNGAPFVVVSDSMSEREMAETIFSKELVDVQTDEDVHEVIVNILKDSEGSMGTYVPELGKIVIFADRIKPSRIRESFFHENIHAILNEGYGEDPRDVAETFWEVTGDSFGRTTKAFIEKKYGEADRKEEFFAYSLSRAIVDGEIDNFLNVFSNDRGREESQDGGSLAESAERGANSSPELLSSGRGVAEQILDALGIERPKPIGKTSSAAEIAAEEAKVDTAPTEGQKEAGNYQKGHIKVDGYDITIENPKGSVRRGVDQDGKAWEQEMHNTYGYIRGTEGVDGDHIDVFLSDLPIGGDVFVVDQVNPKTGEFDEHKVMYGFPDRVSAEKAYLSNYEEGWQGLGAITPVSREEFKKWVESSHRKTKPFALYKSVKTQGDVQVGESKPAETQPAKPAGAVAVEPAGMTDEEVEAVVDSMKAHAIVSPSVEITDENWRGNIETPLGNVKMGENQKEKLFVNGREQQYGMLLETLSNPDVVLEEQDREPNMFHERPSLYLFVKTFQKPDGSKYVHFESVTVSQDGMEVSISSHIIRESQLKNKLKSDRLLYKATALDEPAISSAEQPTSEGSGLSSEGKGTNNNPNLQEKTEKSLQKVTDPAMQKALRRLVSDEKMEELRKQLIAKLNNLNAGLDPERLLLGAMYAVGKIERGVTKFADYAREMVEEIGDVIRPYLKSFYNSVRDMPEAQEYAGQMDSYDTVAKFDVYNFDKKTVPTAIEKAEQVVKEQKVKKQARKIKEEQPSLFSGDLFGAETVEDKNFDNLTNNGETSSEKNSNFAEQTKEVSNGTEREVSRKSSPSSEGERKDGSRAERVREGLGAEPNRSERSGSGRTVENTLRVPEEGEETRDSSGGLGRPRTGDNARVSTSTFHKNRRNNVGERGKDYAPLSQKARFNANVEAVKLMRQLMDDGVEAPTKEQMAVLRQYSGWGGLGTYFNDEDSAENKVLHELLSDEEYNDAVMSINSAYYTPAMVIDALWDIAKAMGFKGGSVLEGSAGIGNIIGQMPSDISQRSDVEAVEIDSISGNILKLLYPDAKVHIQGFQDTQIRNASVDLAVTNVPFVTGLHVFDKVDKDLSRKFENIHDFCIAKNIRKLKPGGIGLFITSAGTLDKSTKLREWIVSEGQTDVVGAFRLNNETFGGTTVTSDIIVVRKRPAGKTSERGGIDVVKASPLRVGTYEDKFHNEKQATMVINDYFKEHPEMMAGEMAFGYEKGDTFRPGSYGLYPVEGKDQAKMLADFVKAMAKTHTEKPQGAVKPAGEAAAAVENQLTAEKEGRMLVDENGRLCVSERGVAIPLGLNDQKVKGYSKAECFKDYQAVQSAVDDVLQQQLNDPDDTKLEPKLKALNAAYDKFTKRYGTLHKNTAISFLRNDIDFPSFQALENYSETKDIKGKVTVKTDKAPVLKQRVLGFKSEPKPKSIKDAVVASIFRSNGIDLGWIADKLNSSGVPKEGRQSGEWTEDEVRKGILVSRLGFEDPSTGDLVIRYKYLSGNVREKLAQAEAYNRPGGDTPGTGTERYSANIEELKKVVPMDIPAHLIDFSLGSSWIPIGLYKDYLKETLDLDNVTLTHIGGTWVLDEGWYRNEKNRAAGVYSEKFRETIYGHQLVAAALNNRPVKVSKQEKVGYGSSATTRTVVDQAATQACAVRVDEIKDEFKQWAKKKMQDNPELASQIEKIYNEKFNALVPMTIGDEFLPDIFEGANMNIHLYGHQKQGVMRGVTSPTMLAHEVGTGKSFTLISTAMEMRRIGTARKPMIVVQNATVAQMTADAKLLYPNAKVLSLSERDRSAEGRRAFYAKIKFNDWDIIIVPQSTFERIPDSPERELQFIQEKIDEKKHVIEAATAAGLDSQSVRRLKKELELLEQEYGDKFLDSDPANDGGGIKRKKDAKKEAASLKKAETRAKEQLDRAVDDVQYFDDLGVDAILVDEAHEYKHLGFQTSIGRGIKGIDPSYSKKCAGLYNKTRSVFERAGWKNVVFATGTPISNTAAEIWTFMKYLMPADVMRDNDIYYFDDFVHNFGSIAQSLEFQTNGKFREVTRFAAYVNKPELIRIWSQVADTVLTKEVGKVQEKIPDLEGGKDQDVFLPQSPSLISIMAAVRAELERFENMSGQEKKENSSIPLTMYGVAKRAAIDPRLVNADAADEPMSKTNAAVKEILADLDKTKSYKGTVAVFCDNQNRLGQSTGVTAGRTVEFNIFEEMKEKLVKQGVPESQISIIKSGMSIVAKQKIFDAVNAGTIRVIMGSTQTLGTGVNIQERLHLLIHMDAPDRPMDYTQRNGRIKRQGNLHKAWGKTIRVVRFGVEDSLDVTAYQRLKTKSGFIDSIMDGKGALLNNQVDRTVEEEEDGLFDNPVAVLSGSQYALKKNQAERELRKYRGKYAQWEADQVYVANRLRFLESSAGAYQSDIEKNQAALDYMRSLFPDGKVKKITVQGVAVDMTSQDGYGTLATVIKEKVNDPVNAIVKRNRENQIYNDEVLPFTIELDGHAVEFKVSVTRDSEWDSAMGRMRTVIHKTTTYSSEGLRLKNDYPSAKAVRDMLDEILEQVVTGQDYQDRIEAYRFKIAEGEKEKEQLQKRVGIEFQFGKELKEAEKRVDEYTELMKEEMKEKEAKYAEQQKAAQESGNTFDLKKAEDSEDEDMFSADEDWDDGASVMQGQPMFRQTEQFEDGETFPIHVSFGYAVNNVLGRRKMFSIDLMPDEYGSYPQLLDAVRRQYPEYYVSIEDGSVKFNSWKSVIAGADAVAKPQRAVNKRAEAGKKSYIERKTHNAINAVMSLAEAMHLDNVEVKTDLDGLEGKRRRAKGFFNRKTGKIVLVLPNNKNREDLINTLLHEGVAHYGLRKMFGENFETFLENVYNNVSPEIKARIDAAMKRNGWSKSVATEEYLAKLAERTDFEHATEMGWWQKIKNFFIEMLANVGLRMEEPLTDNELRYILWRSYDNLLHPGRRGIFDKAREVQMQSRLRVGEYSDEMKTGEAAAVAGETARTVAMEDENEENINDTFNKQLQQQIDGTLPNGHVYNMGKPGNILLSTGFPDVPIELSATHLQNKAKAAHHPFDISELKDLVNAMIDPVAVFAYGDKGKAQNVIVEIEHDGKNFVVGIHFNQKRGSAEVSSIRGLYPKDNAEWLYWISQGKMLYGNKEKIQNLIDQQRRTLADVDYLDLDSVAKIVNSFENPKLFTENIAEGDELYRADADWMDEVARENYEAAVAKDSLKWQESWQDSMVSLKAVQEAIAAETGNKATGAEDAYRFENRMHGKAKNMAEQYVWQYYLPMLKAFNDFINERGMTMQQGMDYLISKHGLERNVYYAFRDAVKEKLADDVVKERKKLEKDYAAKVIDEKDYKDGLKALEKLERDGVYDRMQMVRETLVYKRAKEDYDQGNIGYTEYLRRIERVINSHTGGAYDKYAKDYSGLTETLAKVQYDDAQETKRQVQRAIDPKTRRMLYAEYDREMKDAYNVARQVAEDAVFAAEEVKPAGNSAGTGANSEGKPLGAVKELWKRINAATESTLKENYESGLMSRDMYNKVRAMFNYYVPLRGWDEDKASDVYTYIGRENVFSPAVKKTWGRTSKAENPLAYIGNIAVSTILSGHRNLMKQHFLNYVMNNPTSLVSISESWYENIGTKEDPKWILRSADTAGKSADEVAQIVNDFNEEMAEKERDGMAMPVRGRLRLDVNATQGQKMEHVVEVKRAGRTYELYINGNPKAAQALNGSAAKAVSRISDTYLGRKLNQLNRSMAMFFTSKNPAFIISNLSRDINMAGASVAVNEGAEYNAKFIANVAKVLTPRLAVDDVGKMGVRGLVGKGRGVTGMMPKLLAKWKSGKLNIQNETERLFKEFMDEGGETGFVNMLSIDSFKEKMTKEMGQMNGSSLFGTTKSSRPAQEAAIPKGLRLLGDTFEFYNRCAEDATRFIVYMTSRQMGKSLEDSIADAKDVTLNFNRKGTGANGNAEIRDLFIFVNPAIQALANMYRMAKGHPLKLAGVTLGFVVGGVMIPVINQWLLNLFGDDDDKDTYWNLPPWVRKNNLVFWVPFTKDFVTIPLAQEFRVFYGVGEMIGSYCLDHPHHNMGLEIVESVADLVPVNPTGNGGNLVVDFAPTAAQPILQLTFNTDFTGKPIWKDNQGNKYEPMYSKAYVSAPKWMVEICKAINNATGGDEDVRGWLEKSKLGAYANNPAVWNHLLQGYFGGMYNTIAKSIDVVTTAVQGEMPKVYQVPVVNRFVNRPVERDNAGVLGVDYWEMIAGNEEFQNVIRKKKKRAQGGSEEDKAKYEKLLESEDYHRSLVIDSYQKMIDATRKMEKETSNEAKIDEYKRAVSELKSDLMDELAVIDGGGDPVKQAKEKYDKSEDPRRKKAIATRIAKEAGASKDPYGGEPESDHAYQYQQQRTSEDIWEDALLFAKQEKLRDEGDEKAKNALSNERQNAHYPYGTGQDAFKLHGGNSDREIMKWIRKKRKKLIEKYQLNKKK